MKKVNEMNLQEIYDELAEIVDSMNEMYYYRHIILDNLNDEELKEEAFNKFSLFKKVFEYYCDQFLTLKRAPSPEEKPVRHEMFLRRFRIQLEQARCQLNYYSHCFKRICEEDEKKMTKRLDKVNGCV